jgi:SPP1 gp7 family putative phage head morphogenesis protein
MSVPARSQLEQVEDDFLAALFRREKMTTKRMAQTYRKTVKALVPLWQEAYAKLQAAKLAGYDANYLSGFAFHEYRLARLLEQAERLFTEMAKEVGIELGNSLQDAAGLARASAQATILAELGGTTPGSITAGFVKYPEQQIQRLTGRLSDGSPIDEWAQRYGPRGAQVIKDGLIAGMVNGENPAVLGRRMAKALGADYGKMAVMARTEMLRVYRDTTLETYRANSRLVKGWRWSAALQESTCPVCWAMHGTVFPLSEKMATHPACRCSMRPVLRPWSEINPNIKSPKERPEPKHGPELFAKLPAASQRRILGPLGHDAYKAKMLKLPDLVQETYSPKWGKGRQQRSISATIGPANIRKLRGGGSTPKPKPAPVPKPKPAPKPVGKPKPTPSPKPTLAPQPAPKPAVVPGKPIGPPISGGLDLSTLPKTGKSTPLVNHIKETTKILDSVHGDGDLPGVKVVLDSSKSNHGSFAQRRGFGKRPDGTPTLTRIPDSLTMSRVNSGGPGGHPRMTYAHEVGHYLDQFFVAPRLGMPTYELTNFASETFHARSDLPVMRWYQAVTNSRAVNTLNTMASHGRLKQTYTHIRPDGTSSSFVPQVAWIDYATTPRELWARSYAQYVATRSGDSVMMGELDASRNPLTNAYHAAQWADDDFEPIADAFDELFRFIGALT